MPKPFNSTARTSARSLFDAVLGRTPAPAVRQAARCVVEGLEQRKLLAAVALETDYEFGDSQGSGSTSFRNIDPVPEHDFAFGFGDASTPYLVHDRTDVSSGVGGKSGGGFTSNDLNPSDPTVEFHRGGPFFFGFHRSTSLSVKVDWEEQDPGQGYVFNPSASASVFSIGFPDYDDECEAHSSNPVRYADGAAHLAFADVVLESDPDFRHERHWTNGPMAQAGSRANINGRGMINTARPVIDSLYRTPTAGQYEDGGAGSYTNEDMFLLGIREDGRSSGVFIQSDATGHQRWSGSNGSGALVYDRDNDEYRYSKPSGDTYIFNDFGQGDPNHQPSDLDGRFLRQVKSGGVEILVTERNADNHPKVVQRRETLPDGTTKATHELIYEYHDSASSPGNVGLVKSVRLLTAGDAIMVLQSADYEYYDPQTVGGRSGLLKTVTKTDHLTGGGTTEVEYYRHWVGAPGGGGTAGAPAPGGPDMDNGEMKMVLRGESYERAVAALGGQSQLEAASDAAVLPFADNYFEYDFDGRVTREVAQDAGCSSCGGGQGNFGFEYHERTGSDIGRGRNSWRVRTTETLPDQTPNDDTDNDRNIVYTNRWGQPILKVFQDTSEGTQHATYRHYTQQGKIDVIAHPSAVTGFDEATDTLVGFAEGTQPGEWSATHIGGSGLVELTSFYTADDAADPELIGYRYATHLQDGDDPLTRVAQREWTWVDGAPDDGLWHVATQTSYVDQVAEGSASTEPRVVSYDYEWHTDAAGDLTHQIKKRTTTTEAAAADQNGDNVAHVTEDYFDESGRLLWHLDEAGFVNHYSYDEDTGAMLERVEDADPAAYPAQLNKPVRGAGLAPALAITTSYEVDELGRVVKEVDPNGNVTRTVYHDAERATVRFPGWWDTGDGWATTGPVEVTREVWGATVFTESLLLDAAPVTVTVDGEVVPDPDQDLDALIASGTVVSLSRSLTNNSGQIVAAHSYHSLSGLTYDISAAVLAGAVESNDSATGHYHASAATYDDRGRSERSVDATGTITWNTYDGLGRVVGTYVGTDDTGGHHGDPVGSDPSNNMSLVAEYEYDGGGVGDGNLTRMIEYPAETTGTSGTAEPRVTLYHYDWRNRLVATHAGLTLDGTGSVAFAKTPSLVSYAIHDNLGRVTEQRTYAGGSSEDPAGERYPDTPAKTDGVPDAPAAGKLRSLSRTSYDDRGRAYRSEVVSVDPASGAVGGSLVSDTWYDARGNVIKSAQPGGLVSKTVYDGVGRPAVMYTSDGLGDATYADAESVADDVVLEQAEYTYDANGNVLQVTTRQRFHDLTDADVGPLGTPTTGNLARVSHAASYYDAADRLVASVDVGTNGGGAFARPTNVPARSDVELVTSYGYDAAGRLMHVTDPRGITDRTEYDLMGRTSATLEAFVEAFDDFDRPDGALFGSELSHNNGRGHGAGNGQGNGNGNGRVWESTGGTWSIVDGKAVAVSVGQHDPVVVTDAGTLDAHVSADVHQLGRGVGLVGRWTDQDNFVQAVYDPSYQGRELVNLNAFRGGQLVANAFVYLDTLSGDQASLDAGDRLALELVGDEGRILLNGETIVRLEDADLATLDGQRWGMQAHYASPISYDDFLLQPLEEDANRTTRYTYDGDSNVATLTADLPFSQPDQVTRYDYGTADVRVGVTDDFSRPLDHLNDQLHGTASTDGRGVWTQNRPSVSAPRFELDGGAVEVGAAVETAATVETGHTDGSATATVETSSYGIGLVGRLTDGQNYLYAHRHPNNGNPVISVRSVVGGTETNLGFGYLSVLPAGDIQAGDQIELRVGADDVIRFLVNGQEIVTKNDPNAANAGTGWGIGGRSAGGARYADFAFEPDATGRASLDGVASDVSRNDTLTSIWYPDPVTGRASNLAHREVFSTNRLGERTAWADRNGTRHAYQYDTLGRLGSDVADPTGSGVDAGIVRQTYSFDDAGRPHTFTTRSTLTGDGGIESRVWRTYNGFGQLVEEHQGHGGAGDVKGDGTPEDHVPSVRYGYNTPNGGDYDAGNTARQTSVAYPDGRVVYHHYDNVGGLNDRISRLASLADYVGGNYGTGPQHIPLPTAVDYEQYEYLGLGMVVDRWQGNGVRMTHIDASSTGDAGDPYVGLDRFGRIARMLWTDDGTGGGTGGGSGGGATDYFAYGHDRNGNRLYEENLLAPNLSELYHDGGLADGSTAWEGGYDRLDRLRGFQRGTLAADRLSVIAPSTLTGGQANERLWDLDQLGNMPSVTTGGVAEARETDAQNRLTDVAGSTTAYSANGEMVTDEEGNTLTYDAWGRMTAWSDGTITIEYRYDALGRRIVRAVAGGPDDGEASHRYFSSRWQVLEERDGGGNTLAQHVWSPVYVDALILRDRDTAATPDGDLDERLYAQHDANFNVTAVADEQGAVQLRLIYDPYGQSTLLDATWQPAAQTLIDTTAWHHQHQGGELDTTTGLVHFRNRDLDTRLTRWTRQDPVGYLDGSNLYLHVGNSPTTTLDSRGLLSERWRVSETKYIQVDKAPPIKGSEPPPEGWKVAGRADANWFITNKLDLDNTCPKGQRRLNYNGSFSATVYYEDEKTRRHEDVHVENSRKGYNIAKKVAERLNARGCMCNKQFKCFLKMMNKLIEYARAYTTMLDMKFHAETRGALETGEPARIKAQGQLPGQMAKVQRLRNETLALDQRCKE